MTTFRTQTIDLLNDAIPGFTYTVDSETLTVADSVLLGSKDNSGLFSDLDVSVVFNNGTIYSGASTFFNAGVKFLGEINFVSNSASGRIIGLTDGVLLDGKTITVDNKGLIQGLTENGVNFGTAAEDWTLINSGTIYGRESGVSEFTPGVIRNSGLITSGIDAISIFTDDPLLTTIINGIHGTIRGVGNPEVAGAIDVLQGRISLDNAGTIIGDVDVNNDASLRDVVINHGRIKGNVFLSAGNDLYKGTAGTAGAVHGDGDDDTLIGGRQVDSLFGDFGNDKLAGAAGNDKLHGGFGNDTLIGGVGKDRFFFDAGLNQTFNVDRIADFAVNVDKLILVDDAFFGIGAVGGLAAAKFHVGAGAADQNDRIIYNQNTGFLFFDADGNGGSGQFHFATLAPHLALHNTDFIVVA